MVRLTFICRRSFWSLCKEVKALSLWAKLGYLSGSLLPTHPETVFCAIARPECNRAGIHGLQSGQTNPFIHLSIACYRFEEHLIHR